MSRSIVLCGALLLLAGMTTPVRADDCASAPNVAILFSPAAPVRDRPLRVVVADEAGMAGEFALVDASGARVDAAVVTHPGPPWSAVATVAAPASGAYRALLRHGGQVVACGEVRVTDGAAHADARPRRDWNRHTEALYAAWIEHLFDAPPGDDLTFPSLEPVLRDPARNFLHGHLGVDEDRAVPATPDCADLPYLLRAYFAWKLGLPAGFRHCSRGTATAPPTCGAPVVDDAPGAGADPLRAFVTFARTVVDGVQSGNARTGLADDGTDFYPVPLLRSALRPGTVYADPYGHTLIVAAWLPQTADRAGVLYAVDAQPDQTVARKRFWEGTFLFADEPGAGPGFKAFRPMVRRDGGPPRPLRNAELSSDPDFTPFSDEQASLDPDAFYARIAALANPNGLDPVKAYDATLDALVEQLETRVHSVDNAEKFFASHPGAVIPMPAGAAIFETTGPWEDFSTPSRDLRLLIAMKVLTGLGARIARHPELYVLGDRTAEAARAAVEARHAQQIGARRFTYTRSDGSPWTLTVAQALDRRAAFEVAYDPNDCVELRWGAPDGSDEASTCRRHAPGEQRQRMETYRAWFRDGRRPPR